MKTIKTVIGLIGLICTLNLNAAIILGNFSKIEPQKRTHIIVVGTGEKLDELFFLSAETKAKLILNLYPHDQVVLIASKDDQEVAKRSSFKIIDESGESLKKRVIETIVEQVSEIASLDMFVHSNVVQGAILERTPISTHTIDEKDSLWEKVRPKLRSNSYITIHGCNAGIKMGPTLSRFLGVAVFAALTSTDFQYVYSNGQWIHDYETKTLIKSKDKRIRMKPDNYSYHGYWGDWRSAGYPTYKIFCGSLDRASCGHSALEALISFPSILNPKQIITKEDFKKNLFDFLCPTTERNDVFNECRKHLEHSLISDEEDFYSPFVGKMLNCNFERCEVHFNCNFFKVVFKPGSCKLVNENEDKSDSFVNEFKFYMDAYELRTEHGKKPLVTE